MSNTIPQFSFATVPNRTASSPAEHGAAETAIPTSEDGYRQSSEPLEHELPLGQRVRSWMPGLAGLATAAATGVGMVAEASTLAKATAVVTGVTKSVAPGLVAAAPAVATAVVVGAGALLAGFAVYKGAKFLLGNNELKLFPHRSKISPQGAADLKSIQKELRHESISSKRPLLGQNRFGYLFGELAGDKVSNLVETLEAKPVENKPTLYSFDQDGRDYTLAVVPKSRGMAALQGDVEFQISPR